MPKTPQYLQGFGIRQGIRLGGYELVDIQVDHETVRRYQQYRYPTRLTWNRIDSLETADSLLSALVEHLRSDRVVYTSYGNPYQCNFGTLEVTDPGPNQVTIEAQGTCERI